MTEQHGDKIKADKLMQLLARPPEDERDSSSEQELKWNAERRRKIEEKRQQNRLEWYEYHRRLQDHHARLAEDHRAQADALEPPEE